MDELFDLVVDSSFEGVRKPNADIFHLTLERLGGLDAGDTVFLDDHEANVAAAKAVGMQTVHVTEDIQLAIKSLDQLLNKPRQQQS